MAREKPSQLFPTWSATATPPETTLDSNKSSSKEGEAKKSQSGTRGKGTKEGKGGTEVGPKVDSRPAGAEKQKEPGGVTVGPTATAQQQNNTPQDYKTREKSTGTCKEKRNLTALCMHV